MIVDHLGNVHETEMDMIYEHLKDVESSLEYNQNMAKADSELYLANNPNIKEISDKNTVKGSGNTTYVLKPNGQWWQHDNFGPVGPMPQGWTPPPVRAPGK